jgi:hypothetical protein
MVGTDKGTEATIVDPVKELARRLERVDGDLVIARAGLEGEIQELRVALGSTVPVMVFLTLSVVLLSVMMGRLEKRVKVELPLASR